jgi:hypothetical protein
MLVPLPTFRCVTRTRRSPHGLVFTHLRSASPSSPRLPLFPPPTPKHLHACPAQPRARFRRQLLQAASDEFGLPGMFELGIGNADKGTLSHDVLAARCDAFAERGLPLSVTAAPLFVDKARLFRNSLFVLGHDTARRIVLAKYYASETRMALEFAALRDAGCRFAVAGRLDKADGRFKTMADIDVPLELSEMHLFSDIPESRFRADISSTELRERKARLGH